MKRLVLDLDVGSDMLIEIINFIDNLEGEGMIYLTSEGGDTQYGYWILDILNKHKDVITLNLGQHVMSAAFHIAYHFSGAVIVNDLTIGMIHSGSNIMNIANSLAMDRKKSHDKCVRKDLESFTFLSKKERSDFIRGIDIYLTNERMKKIYEQKAN